MKNKKIKRKVMLFTLSFLVSVLFNLISLSSKAQATESILPELKFKRDGEGINLTGKIPKKCEGQIKIDVKCSNTDKLVEFSIQELKEKGLSCLKNAKQICDTQVDSCLELSKITPSKNYRLSANKKILSCKDEDLSEYKKIKLVQMEYSKTNDKTEAIAACVDCVLVKKSELEEYKHRINRLETAIEKLDSKPNFQNRKKDGDKKNKDDDDEDEKKNPPKKGQTALATNSAMSSQMLVANMGLNTGYSNLGFGNSNLLTMNAGLFNRSFNSNPYLYGNSNLYSVNGLSSYNSINPLIYTSNLNNYNGFNYTLNGYYNNYNLSGYNSNLNPYYSSFNPWNLNNSSYYYPQGTLNSGNLSVPVYGTGINGYVPNYSFGVNGSSVPSLSL